jgi:hypothetical protein
MHNIMLLSKSNLLYYSSSHLIDELRKQIVYLQDISRKSNSETSVMKNHAMKEISLVEERYMV